MGSYFLIQWYNNRPVYFDYAGVRWYQEGKEGMYSYRGEFSLPTNSLFALYLREDPRKNNVSLEVPDWGFYKDVIISRDQELEQCYEAVLAQFNLVYFLSGGLKRNMSSAMFNQSQAEERGFCRGLLPASHFSKSRHCPAAFSFGCH